MSALLIAVNALALLVAFVALFAFIRRRGTPLPSQPPAETGPVPETAQQLNWPALQHALEQIAMLDIEIRRLKTATEERDASWEARMAAMSTRIQRLREPKGEKPLSEEEQLKRLALEQLTMPVAGDTAQTDALVQQQGEVPRPLLPSTAQRFQRRGA